MGQVPSVRMVLAWVRLPAVGGDRQVQVPGVGGV